MWAILSYGLGALSLKPCPRESGTGFLTRRAAFHPLALGTMPIAAGVVGNPRVTAVTAGVDVPTQSGCAAGDQATHDGCLHRRHGVASAVCLPVGAENVRHLQERTCGKGDHGYAFPSAALAGSKSSGLV